MTRKLIAIPMAFAVVFALGGVSKASAQVATPAVQIQMLTNSLTSPLVTSSTGATVARLVLNTTGSGEPVSISSLPFILSTGGGALSSSLFNCQAFNEANPTLSLSSATQNVLSSGVNSVALMSPIILQPNTSTTFDLRCDVSSTLVSGGTYTFSMNTVNVVASGTITGRQASVTVIGSSIPTPTTPGLPTTGASGNASRNVAILMGSVMLGGLGLILRKNNKTREA